MSFSTKYREEMNEYLNDVYGLSPRRKKTLNKHWETLNLGQTKTKTQLKSLENIMGLAGDDVS